MSWGTDFKADIYILRETFDSADQVEFIIEETDGSIQDCRERVKMIGAATPRDITSEDDDPLFNINRSLDEELEELERLLVYRYQIGLLLDEVRRGNVDLEKTRDL